MKSFGSAVAQQLLDLVVQTELLHHRRCAQAGDQNGNIVTGITMNVGERIRIDVSPSAYTTFTSLNPSIANAPDGLMSLTAKYMIVEGYSPGTATIYMMYEDGGTKYYNTLIVKVTQSTTEFYQNHNSQDNTIVATLQQTVGQPFNLLQIFGMVHREDRRYAGNILHNGHQTSHKQVVRPLVGRDVHRDVPNQ